MSSEIRLAPSAWGTSSSVIEMAKEELEILELQHPDRFQYLKTDLKNLISDTESHNLLLCHSNTPSISTCPSALLTQESSSRKKRKNGSWCNEEGVSGDGSIKKRGKTDAILHRAQQCLHKIQLFKTGFY